MKYPEHEKLQARLQESQTISEFLDFLSEQGWHLGYYHEHVDAECWGKGENNCHLSGEYLNYVHKKPDEIIGLFLDIDPKKLSEEKDAMYQELRSEAVKKTSA